MKIFPHFIAAFPRLFVLLFVRIIDFLVFDEHLISFPFGIDALHRMGAASSVIFRSSGTEALW